MQKTLLANVACMLLLGACGGAGGSTFNVPQFDTVADAVAANAEAAARIAALDATVATEVPANGSATYAGPILINDISGSGQSASVSGGIEVIVDFANANNIRGEAGNFFDPDGSASAGSLSVSDTDFTLVGAESGFRARLAGRLMDVGADGSEADFDYDLELAQTFAGDDAQALLGAGAGTATAVGTSGAQAVTVANALEQR